VQSVPNGWVLNPNCAFHLTIEGTDRAAALRVKELLNSTYAGRNREAIDVLTGVIARSNLRCVEVEAYLREWRPHYLNRIEELKATSKEWPAAGEMDREDLLVQFKEEALDVLKVRPYGELGTLLDGQSGDEKADDALIDRFGFETLQAYLQYSGTPGKVHRIPADHYYRERFEQLAEKRLARRGADIPVPAILTSFKLKEMNDLAAPLGLGPFRRKAQAVEALAAAPDITKALANVVAFRELFQLQPLPDEYAGMDLSALASGWVYARGVAELMAHTYTMSSYDLQRASSDLGGLSYIQSWVILVTSDSCPFCIEAAQKTYPKTRRPHTPLHLGCRCTVMPKLREA
jgi:hypothetical protein